MLIDRNLFVVFEGGEGSGKSTLVNMLCNYLIKQRVPCIATKDPGGCNIANQIRQIVLSPQNHYIHPATELLLYQAARNELWHSVIYPALLAKKTVICDRFIDSTTVYQGIRRGWSDRILDFFITDIISPKNPDILTPDVVILLDVDPEVGLTRSMKKNNAQAVDESRIEQEGLFIHKKMREAYLRLAHQNPDRFIVIDTTDIDIKTAFDQVIAQLEVFTSRG